MVNHCGTLNQLKRNTVIDRYHHRKEGLRLGLERDQLWTFSWAAYLFLSLLLHSRGPSKILKYQNEGNFRSNFYSRSSPFLITYHVSKLINFQLVANSGSAAAIELQQKCNNELPFRIIWPRYCRIG